MKKTIFLVLSSASISCFAQTHEYKVTNTYHIKSAGGWDYIAVNNDKIYTSHGSQVNILNESTGDSVGIIPNTYGIHGIAFDNASGKGFTSNGRTNSVTVFDLKTNQTLDTIPTVGENPDAIMFEPYTKTIITCNGKTNNLSVIDPVQKKVIKIIDVGGKPEKAASDGTGKLFVNIEDKNEIVEVDLKTLSVENHWSLDGGEEPTGLEYDPDTKRLFASCDKQLVVMDAASGKVINKLPIGEGCDGVAFDKKNKIIFTSNGAGTVTAIKENNASSFTVLGNYPTKRGARTITIDENTGALYLPTAEFEPNTPEGTRPKMIAGTFQVLEVK
jgi:YVTN family beta-propeller protein